MKSLPFNPKKVIRVPTYSTVTVGRTILQASATAIPMRTFDTIFLEDDMVGEWALRKPGPVHRAKKVAVIGVDFRDSTNKYTIQYCNVDDPAAISMYAGLAWFIKHYARGDSKVSNMRKRTTWRGIYGDVTVLKVDYEMLTVSIDKIFSGAGVSSMSWDVFFKEYRRLGGSHYELDKHAHLKKLKLKKRKPTNLVNW